MQLSAANLLLAAQQSAKPQPQSAASGFAAALSGQQKTQSFAPIDFKQPAKAAPGASQMPQATAARPGAAIDIRV
jgi:hypothetical protein